MMSAWVYIGDKEKSLWNTVCIFFHVRDNGYQMGQGISRARILHRMCLSCVFVGPCVLFINLVFTNVYYSIVCIWVRALNVPILGTSVEIVDV